MPPKPAPAPTHFLCIPLVTAQSRTQLVRSLAAFRADVTEAGAGDTGLVGSGPGPIPVEAVRPVGTLHLTLGLFSFARDEDGIDTNGGGGLAKAAELLAALRMRHLLGNARPGPEGDTAGPGPQKDARLTVTLRGLASMQPAARAVVLYATPVDPLGRLQAFAERARRVFREAGLMTAEARPLLLHATIVNTGHVKTRQERKPPGRPAGRARKWGRLTVDARGLLDRYDDQVWMEDVAVETLAICKMGAKKVGGEDDEAYEVVAEVVL